MNIIVLQTGKEHLEEIQRVAQQTPIADLLSHNIIWTTDPLGVVVESERLARLKEPLLVISGLDFQDLRYNGDAVARFVKRVHPSCVFLLYTRIPLHQVEMIPAMDGVIPLVDEKGKPACATLVRILTMKRANATPQDIKLSFPEILMNYEVLKLQRRLAREKLA